MLGIRLAIQVYLKAFLFSAIHCTFICSMHRNEGGQAKRPREPFGAVHRIHPFAPRVFGKSLGMPSSASSFLSKEDPSGRRGRRPVSVRRSRFAEGLQMLGLLILSQKPTWVSFSGASPDGLSIFKSFPSRPIRHNSRSTFEWPRPRDALEETACSST